MEEQALKHFIEYNEQFFEGKLNKIKLQWSNRMQISAAIFYPCKDHPRESGKICLNQKLLKSRSEKEVLETLLVSSRENFPQIKLILINFCP